MLIAGAGRHAKDLMALSEISRKELVFFDDTTTPPQSFFLEEYQILNRLSEAKQYLTKDKRFILGLGGTQNRKKVSDKLLSIGGELTTISAVNITVGNYDVVLGDGLNIMQYAFISNSVRIGTGTLINTRVSLHHDVEVGAFCDIGPGSVLLGGANVGEFTQIGASATILPNVTIGDNCTVGAGAVVTEDVQNNSLVAGVPAEKKMSNK